MGLHSRWIVATLAACLFASCASVRPIPKPARPVTVPKPGPGELGSLTWELLRGRHPVTNDVGKFQFQGVGQIANDNGGSDNDADFRIEYGVLEGLTLAGAVGSGGVNQRFRASDPGTSYEFSGMYGIIDEGQSAVSARLDVRLTEDSSNAVRESDVEFKPWLLAGTKLDDGTEVYGGAGLSLNDGGEEQFLANAAAVMPIGDVGVILEFDGRFADGSQEMYLTPGVVFDPRDPLQAMFGFSVGLSDDSADWMVHLSLALQFGAPD